MQKLGRVYIPLLALGVVLVVGFQNCSKAVFKDANTTVSMSGNGENYDGKPYIHVDPKQPCSTSDKANARMVVTSTTFTLVREQCQDLPSPREISTSLVTVDSTRPGLLTYQSPGGEQAFILDAAELSRSQSPVLTCVSRNINPVDTLRVYSVAHQGRNVLVGLADKGTTQNILAFNNQSAALSSTLNINGRTQDGGVSIGLSAYNPSSSYPDGCNVTIHHTDSQKTTEAYLLCSQNGAP